MVEPTMTVTKRESTTEYFNYKKSEPKIKQKRTKIPEIQPGSIFPITSIDQKKRVEHPKPPKIRSWSVEAKRAAFNCNNDNVKRNRMLLNMIVCDVDAVVTRN